jgi:hypothetical protein
MVMNMSVQLARDVQEEGDAVWECLVAMTVRNEDHDGADVAEELRTAALYDFEDGNEEQGRIVGGEEGEA